MNENPRLAHAVWFETHIIAQKIAIASLERIPRAKFLADAAEAIEAARWQAKMSETEAQFRDRIRADLQAEGGHGHVVVIYQHGAFFEHNFSLLRPAVRPVIEASVVEK